MNPIDTTSKAFDLVVNHPTGPLFDPSAQKWMAIGIIIFLTLWGIAKVRKAGK